MPFCFLRNFQTVPPEFAHFGKTPVLIATYGFQLLSLLGSFYLSSHSSTHINTDKELSPFPWFPLPLQYIKHFIPLYQAFECYIVGFTKVLGEVTIVYTISNVTLNIRYACSLKSQSANFIHWSPGSCHITLLLFFSFTSSLSCSLPSNLSKYFPKHRLISPSEEFWCRVLR